MRNFNNKPLFTFILLLFFSGSLFAQSVEDEINGVSKKAPTISNNSPRGTTAIPAGGLLLIPDSGHDRIMAFDPTTGDLVNADFIPSDPTNLSTPIEIIFNHDHTGFLISDQINDVVHEYDLDGNYVGVFAPAGGANTSIMGMPRGICLRPNGNLLVTLGATVNAGACIEFDTDGNYLGVFLPATGTSTFDVIRLADDTYMTGDIDADALYTYDAAGSLTGTFASINTFPEQIFQTGSGNILVGNFSGTEEGVVEYTSTGTLVDIYDPPTLDYYRGAYELPNGNILTTNSAGVHEIDRSGNLVETKTSNGDARYITLVQPTGQVPLSPLVIPVVILVVFTFVIIRFRSLLK